MFDYWNLKVKIMEVYKTQAAFADAMEMSLTAVNARLNGSVEWKSPEIAKACNLLDIPYADAWKYFFNPKL